MKTYITIVIEKGASLEPKTIFADRIAKEMLSYLEIMYDKPNIQIRITNLPRRDWDS